MLANSITVPLDVVSIAPRPTSGAYVVSVKWSLVVGSPGLKETLGTAKGYQMLSGALFSM